MILCFGKRLRELRLEKNLTQAQLGNMFNVDQTTISDWENRGYEPSYQILIDLSVFFDVTTDYLLGLEN